MTRRNSDNERRFDVDEIVTLLSPHAGVPESVQYRGRLGDQAVVVLNGWQMTVPLAWLSRRKHKNPGKPFKYAMKVGSAPTERFVCRRANPRRLRPGWSGSAGYYTSEWGVVSRPTGARGGWVAQLWSGREIPSATSGKPGYSTKEEAMRAAELGRIVGRKNPRRRKRGTDPFAPPGWRKHSADAKQTVWTNQAIPAVITVRHGAAYGHAPVILQVEGHRDQHFMFVPDAARAAASMKPRLRNPRRRRRNPGADIVADTSGRRPRIDGGWLTGEWWVASTPGGPKHLHVSNYADRWGGWSATVMNNGVVLKSTGGGAAGPKTEADIVRIARNAAKSIPRNVWGNPRRRKGSR